MSLQNLTALWKYWFPFSMMALLPAINAVEQCARQSNLSGHRPVFWLKQTIFADISTTTATGLLQEISNT